MFIYCFNKKDKDDLTFKGYKFIKEDNIDGKISYVFLCDNKLNFELDKKKFIVTNKMDF